MNNQNTKKTQKKEENDENRLKLRKSQLKLYRKDKVIKENCSLFELQSHMQLLMDFGVKSTDLRIGNNSDLVARKMNEYNLEY